MVNKFVVVCKWPAVGVGIDVGVNDRGTSSDTVPSPVTRQ